MSSLKKLIRLLAFSFVITCGSESKHQEPKVVKQVFDHDIVLVANIMPKREGYWEEPPDVIVCNDAPYTLSRVEKSVRFWKNLNYKIGSVTKVNNFEVCIDPNRKFARNKIIIKLRGQKFDESKYAVTSTYKIINSEKIVGAVIQLQEYATEIDWVLEHEIGHALGWRHHNISGHLMNEKAQLGGWGIKGLRIDRY